MKLRIRGNTLRLRLTKSEVAAVLAEGACADAIDFGATKMQYALRAYEGVTVRARYEHGAMTVEAPREVLARWASGDDVALGGERDPVGPSVLVEKDFACLTVRAGEDDSDAYANPNESC